MEPSRWWRRWIYRHSCEGAEAKVAAERHLLDAQEMHPRVTEVAESLRELREENHFANRIENLIRKGMET